MTIESLFGDLNGKQLTVAFAFKDKKSKAAVFESYREHRGSRLRATVSSARYVSDFEYNELPSNRRHTVGKIESFEPNVEIADGEYTLEGMGIVDGMYVDDKVKGVKYWYKTPPRFAAETEIPLEEADFIRTLRARQSDGTSEKEGDDANSARSNQFYLRDYQTGRLIGPINLTPGYLLPLLNKKTTSSPIPPSPRSRFAGNCFRLMVTSLISRWR